MSLSIDWTSQDTHWLTSPHWKKQDEADFQVCKKEAPDIPATIWIQSSGSTSQQTRWFAISKAAFVASAKGVNQHLQTKASDVWLKTIPSFHVGGLSILARAHVGGFSVVEQEKWSPEAFHEAVKINGVTLASLVPTQVFDLVVLDRKSVEGLRAIVVGGDALSEELYTRARELGFPLLPSYGSTETCSQIATATLKSLEFGTYPRMKFLSHVEVNQTPKGTLKVYSESLFTGELTLSNSKDVKWLARKQPYFLTADLAELRSDELVRVSRPESWLKISGELLSLDRLRNRLRTSIQSLGLVESDCELVVAPDERRGQQVVLVCTGAIKDGEKVLKRFNHGQKSIEQVSVLYQIDEIPRSALGKLQSGRLLALLGYESK